MEYILWFDQITKDLGTLVGGKGANLGEMVSFGMPVPQGFAITTKAFDIFIELNRIKDQIQQMIDNCNVDDTQKLLETSKRIKNLIVSKDYPQSIKAEIKKAYEELSYARDIKLPEAIALISAGREYALVAVRSSATTEDLPSIGKEEHVIVRIGDEIVYNKMEEIYKLYEKDRTKKIFVPSLDGNNIDWIEVQDLYKHPANNVKLAKITTKTGRHITITPNHSLVALDEDEFKLKTISIKEVGKNTRIPVVKYLPYVNNNENKILDVCEILKSKELAIEKNRVKIKDVKNWMVQNDFPRFVPIDKEFAYFLGIYAAEGSTYKSCVDISCQSKEIASKVKKYLEGLGFYLNKDPYNVRTFNKVLVCILHELFGKPLNIKGKGKLARIKRVPNLMFNQSKDVIAEFLKGCFDGDGYAGKNSISIVSVSEDLIGGLVKLLEMLEIKCYIGKNGIEITVPPSEAEKFMQIIGFTEERNIKKLTSLIANYKKRKHNDINDTIPASKKINSLMEQTLKSKLNIRLIDVFLCPDCNSRLVKNGRFWKQRFLCNVCGKTFSSDKNFKKEKIATYLEYDDIGRFKKGGVPWNKGNRRQLSNYSISTIKKIAEKIQNEKLLSIANSNVLWDRIKKIEYIDYSGYVYDFVVPKTQNFCAGVGGIITHNTASFAGQQSSFLNVKGVTDLLESVKNCWASLFEPRAIFYRAKHGFKSASISVIAQRMVSSEKSGVIFTVNPATGEDVVLIESTWGLGESLVLGEVRPDSYTVSKDGKILDIKIGKKERMKVRDVASDRTIELKVHKDKIEQQVLSEYEIKRLAEYALKIENHYKKPQDIEFAIERDRIYIVQTRSVTTEVKEKIGEVSGEVIVKGLGSSPGIATGIVRVIRKLEDLAKVQQGDVLVTKMTSPDMVVTMSKSAAIITDEGGMTAHASIVSREMGIPAIVGTRNAMSVLQDGQKVTVDAYHGVVYAGEIEIKKPEVTKTEVPIERVPTKIAVKVNLAFALDNLEEIANATDGVGLLRIEHMVAKSGIHPAKLIYENRSEDYVKILVDGIKPIAQAFAEKPVWIRTLDARSDEFRNLEGGQEESQEANPMLGWHGIRRSLDEPELLKAEFEAIKRLHEEGSKNVHVMLPFVISVDEFRRAREIAKEVGLPENCKIGIMCETIGAALTMKQFCKSGVDFVSIGSNDLTQLVLGVDRGNAKITELYSEFHPAVLSLMKHIIEVCSQYDVESSICGESGSNPEMVEKLVKYGIRSVSCNIDAIEKIRETVVKVERP